MSSLVTNVESHGITLVQVWCRVHDTCSLDHESALATYWRPTSTLWSNYEKMTSEIIFQQKAKSSRRTSLP